MLGHLVSNSMPIETHLKLCLLALTLLLAGISAQAPQPDDFYGPDAPYAINQSDPSANDVSADNRRATFLYGYNKCIEFYGDNAKAQIDEAYLDAYYMSNTNGVKANIDWNQAAALEFLGPPGLNKQEQGQIQAVFANTATVIWSYNPAPGWNYIKVRCDDRPDKCKLRCDPDGKPTYSNVIAYSSNKDFDDSRYPMINFCPRFFLRPDLGRAIAAKKDLVKSIALNIDEYFNRGSTFLHELFHLDLAANSPSPNPRVLDLRIVYRSDSGLSVDEKAYGGLLTKVLARWKGTAGQSVGYWVQRNADNLSLYALAKYIMTKNGNVYPHLPMAATSPTQPPYHSGIYPIVQSGDHSYVNTSTVFSTTGDSDLPKCHVSADDDDGTNATDEDRSVMVDEFSADSEYPDEYIQQVQSWINDAENDANTGSTAGAQQLAIASYTNPLADPAAWSRLISYDTNKLSVLVANVLNGPDYIVNDAWADVIQRAAASGKTIIGYVRTGYLGVSQQNFKTRLGSSDLADWASQIEQDVDKWYELYPQIGGIFFDEGWPECGTNNVYSELYAYINAYTKRKHPGAFTVLNPGSPMAQCFENTMDTLLTFESFYDYYKNSYVPNNWTPQDARKIWHIVYNVPQDKVAEVADLARSRGAGLIEITDDTTPNPYDNVPSEAYMQAAMTGVSGGTLNVNPAKDAGGKYRPGMPTDPQVTKLDYTSATLTWTQVADALGYGVYQDDALVLELPASLTRATVGMLTPGTSGIKLEVRTLVSSDSLGTPRYVTITTKALPDDGSISNVHWSQDGNIVTYTADVLVPFAFVRLFIESPHSPDSASAGWPIVTYTSSDGFNTYPHYKLVNYLVEGNDFYSGFYKYTGAYYEGSPNNADWGWTQLDVAPQSQSGYQYTWKVPLGATDGNPNLYVIQGQGYAPLQNRANGNTRSSNCRDLSAYCYDY